jgi:hypothetical protein
MVARTGFGFRLMTVTGWHAGNGLYQPLRSGAWTGDVKPGGTLTCTPYCVGEEKRQYLVSSYLVSSPIVSIDPQKQQK